MKKILNFVLAVALVGGFNIMASCKKATDNNETAAQQQVEKVEKVENTELIRTSQSWDGVELPDYFKGRPELVAVKYVFPAARNWVGIITP